MTPKPQARPGNDQRSRIVVELFRDPGTPGGAQFSCSLSDWNFLWELARTFGWHPIGTTYLLRHGQPAQHLPIKHDYQPGDSQDRKRVEANDCWQWIAALEGARRSPFLSGMLQAHAKLQPSDSGATEAALGLLIQNFIEFARRGPFTISLRDAE